MYSLENLELVQFVQHVIHNEMITQQTILDCA